MSNVIPMVSSEGSNRDAAVWNSTITLFLKAEIAYEAVCVIEEFAKTSEQNSMGAIAITKLLADYFGWDQQQRHNFRLSLARNLMPGAELEPIPAEEYAVFRNNFEMEHSNERAGQPALTSPSAYTEQTSAARMASSNPEFVVFYSILGSIRQIINARYAAHSHDFLLSLREEMTDIHADSAWIEWAETLVREGKVRKLKPFPDHKKMAEIVHTFYNAVVDAVGPVDADRVLSDAIAKVEKSPVAASYSPKNFL